MNEREFKERTKRFALDVITLVDRLPQRTSATILGRQVLRSATSIGANYRAACRAKSKADMIAKLATVEEEADETLYWFELIEAGGMVGSGSIKTLAIECNEITAMTVASIKTLRKGL
ncbi:MAG: four helix bundle protein [Lentisphaerae bacterium]|nr:four helix bundle protein [Lentisphaerota bacterium]